MREHQSSIAPGKGPSSANAVPTPGKQTLTQGLPGKPKAAAPPAAKSAKTPEKKKDVGKGGKPREYQMWVHQWVEIVSPAQVLDLDEDGTTAGTDASIPAGKRGQVVAEIVDGPIQIELGEEDRETGQLRRVWIQREDAALTIAEDGDQMSHDPERTTAAAQSGSAKTAKTSKALLDLGEMPSMGKGFCETAGGLVEALVPELGDSSKMVLRVNIPVSGGLLYFSFMGSVERDNMIDDNQYKARLEFSAGYGADKGAWIFKAFVEAGVFGYLEASGDSGKETFNLLTYGISRMVATVSEEAAKYVFDKGESAQAIEKGMDREDYAQVGAGVRASAALEAGGHKVGGSVEASGAARFSGKGAKGHEKGVETETIAMGQAGITWATGDWSFGGSAAVTIGLTSERLLAINGSATASKSLDLAELRDLVGPKAGARIFEAWGIDALTAIGPMVMELLHTWGSSIDPKPIQDGIGTAMANVSGARLAGVLGATSIAQAVGKVSDLGDVSAPMSYEVGIDFEWKPGIGTSLSIQLKRVSAIEMGKESGEAGTYAKIENATRILKLQLNNQSWSAK